MRFEIPRDLLGLERYLDRFVALAGGKRWWKRVNQLDRDGKRSLPQAKIIADYHWLEMELSAQFSILRKNGRLLPQEIFPQSMATLMFAAMVVEVHQRLDSAGRVHLEGRLRDGLKTGYPALFLEMDTALMLLGEGFEVEFPDLEGRSAFDLLFWRGAIEGEVECKSLSADAGRKIHRKDFYRFIDALAPVITARAEGGADEVLIVTVEDRFPSDAGSQATLKAAASEMLEHSDQHEFNGKFFTLKRESIDCVLSNAPRVSSPDFDAACRVAFGDNCHMSGPIAESGTCIIVVRSRHQDDHSKPLLEVVPLLQTAWQRS